MQIKNASLIEKADLLEENYKEALEKSGLKSFPFFKSSRLKVIEGQFIQALVVYRLLGSNALEIDFIATHPDYRGRGRASALIRALAEDFKGYEFWLELHEDNVEAYCFYKKLGFQLSGRRKKYYNNQTKAALIMTRPKIT